MTYQTFKNPYTRKPPIYNDDRSLDMDRHVVPLLYHHQPSSPDDSPKSSSAPGTNFGHYDTPMEQPSGIGGYSSAPYQHSQPVGQGLPPSAGQGYDVSQSPQSYALVMPQSQSVPTHSRTNSHHSSSDCYMRLGGDNMEHFINFPPNDSPSPDSSSLTSHSGRMHGPRRATDQETEAYLRKNLSIPEEAPVNLWSLPDSAKPPKVSDMIKLAIWGSQNHRLTLRQIYDEIEKRYPLLKQAEDKPWQRSIRHNLSLKAMFVREERPQSDPGKGYYWTLDIAMGDGNKRDRKRKRDGHIKDEDEDTDISSESQGDTILPSTSPQHHPDNIHQAMYMPGHHQQGMMHGQAQYVAQPSREMTFNQTAPGGASLYNTGMGHPQNITFQTGHASPSSSGNPAWGVQPMLHHMGTFDVPGHGNATQDHYHQQQNIGSSHWSNPTGGMSTRSQQQAGHLSHSMMPMQGSFVPQMENMSHPSMRSPRRRHSDTSPKADADEQARSVPRQRSGNRS